MCKGGDVVNKVYAITQGDREYSASRILPQPAQVGPTIRLGYYMWCIKGDRTTVLVDTGLNDQEATKRAVNGPAYLKAQLERLNVDLASIETVLITHLHEDHFSSYQLYPRATFAIQRREMDFLTEAIRFRQVAYSAPDLSEVRRLEREKRVRFLNGDEQIAPSIRVVLVGGHTPGSQVVVVTTEKGEAVICGDALDLYRNLEEGVVSIGADLLQALLAHDKIKALASSPELIIPSHDPLVLKRFPNPVEGVAEIG